MFPNVYFLPADHAAVLDAAATLILFGILPLVIAQGQLLDPPGVTILTRTPLSPEAQEKLHLVPFENL